SEAASGEHEPHRHSTVRARRRRGLAAWGSSATRECPGIADRARKPGYALGGKRAAHGMEHQSLRPREATVGLHGPRAPDVKDLGRRLEHALDGIRDGDAAHLAPIAVENAAD